MHLIRCCTAMFFALLVSSSTQAESIDFEKQIQPIFAEHCADCHGADYSESGLRVDDRASLLRGGDHGEPSIVPEKPDASFLLKVIRGEQPDLEMPPGGPPLEKEQIALIEKWIAAGAPWPGQMDASADDVRSDHWSLQPVAQVDPPCEATGESNAIDAFLARKLREKNLQLSKQEDSVALVRRVYFVLTGLPPTPDEVQAVLDHPAGFDVAYGELVDRLLASPRYGERWAQHWLDVIRWAETAGFETNSERPNAWPYRDWVIESLNNDKPYNQFLFEQLAGDSVEQDAALGFLVAGPANLPGQIGRDEESMRQARQDELDEVVRTVGQAFFGLTIGCARCHNHKFDPILQRDYYAMQGIFAGLTYGERRRRGPEDDAWAAQIPQLEEKLAKLRADLQAMRKSHGLRPPLENLETETFEPIMARAVRMEIAATTNGASASLYELQAFSVPEGDEPTQNIALASLGATPSASSFALSNQSRHFDNLVDGTSDRRQAFPWVSGQGGPAWVQVDFQQPTTIHRVVWESGESTPASYVLKVLPVGSDEWVTVADTSQRMLREDDMRSADSIALAGVSDEQVQAIVTNLGQLRSLQAEVGRLSSGPQVFAANFTTSPDPTWLLLRGNAMQRGEELAPAIPLVLGSLEMSKDEPEQQRRLALAKHLTSADHPLTARVIVNRVWQQHFGIGLVDTPSDFGKKGSTPTHPELLDWLAADFMEQGWSLKQLHRQIVMSKAFRQSSQPQEDGLAVDADSRLLWRFPPRRIEAEAIRDSILVVSGKMNLDMGGPGFNLFNQRGGLSDYLAVETFEASGWRRMVYAHKIRMQAVDIFGSFDCPDAGQMTPKRTRSVTPIQALGLFNSPFVVRQASFFAERIRSSVGDDVSQQIDCAFRLALSRPASEEEQAELASLVEQHGLEQLCRAIFNSSEFLFIQ
ncbi:PSD1 and planctomycete cytochrome C domain-containing protein [Aeoliella mucimassa]|uniref:Planctomycete cytochrome C n=1 Tax=Aeoliella mucimassa TaxID=2527972 RepID=A0A518API9_9BACT|nr:PSD1 and planctomycete cytochrome C domain-containing protein [Aeoliella mucimassa]QDU56624.1 Planctomycete cytochrome C [Aeoliella mucimassa]